MNIFTKCEIITKIKTNCIQVFLSYRGVITKMYTTKMYTKLATC